MRMIVAAALLVTSVAAGAQAPAASDLQKLGPQVGERAPDFSLEDQAGGYYQVSTGLPQQQQVTIQGVPVFNLGRNSLGRTPTFSNLDLNIMQEVRLFGRTRVTLEANIDNVFDQKIVTALGNSPYRDAIPVSPAEFFAGFDTAAVVADRNSNAITTDNIRPSALFGLPSTFQGARAVRVAARFRF